MAADDTDWSLLPLPGAVPAAAYLVGQYAKQYRLVVDVLEAQRQVTLTGVGFSELRGLIASGLAAISPSTATPAHDLLDDLSLQARLDQLVAWGTCTSWQDRAETQDDFLRNRSRYQLSDAGFQLNSAVRLLEAELGATSTAVLRAPAMIVERLTAAVAALDAEDFDAADKELGQVHNTLDAMGRAATQWQNLLANALGGSPNEDKVARLLETILTYAEVWGAGVDAWSQPIAQHLPRLHAVTEAQWRAMALARLQATASPELLARTITQLRGDVEVLATWFDGPLPQSLRLRRQIRDAVAPVLRGHRALLAVGGTVSRKADLLRLATALEGAPTDDAAWQVWCTATGLYSARHVTDTAPETAQGHRLSTWEAEPVPLSRRLRAHGPRALTGRAPHIVDRRAARLQARLRAQRERVDAELAGAALVARSGTALSGWGSLGAAEADLLLELVSAARRHGGSANTDRPPPREAVSADGRWTLRLTERPGSAVIAVPDGRLVLADAIVEVAG